MRSPVVWMSHRLLWPAAPLLDPDQTPRPTTPLTCPLICVEGNPMSAGNIVLLCIVVGGITLFGAALAWASWAEARDQRRKLQASAARSSEIAKTVGPG